MLRLHLSQHVQSGLELHLLQLCRPLAPVAPVPALSPAATTGSPGDQEPGRHPAQLGEDPEPGQGGHLAGCEGDGADGEGDGGGVLVDLQQQDQGSGEDGQRQQRGTHLQREMLSTKY